MYIYILDMYYFYLNMYFMNIIYITYLEKHIYIINIYITYIENIYNMYFTLYIF